jgi:adenine-specific DNA-methyltransferase
MTEHDFVYEKEDHAAAWTNDYVFNQLIPYIGNKRKLLDLIQVAIKKTSVLPGGTFLDLFAGSGVVARMAKKMGFRVIANDWEPYALEINRCSVECNAAPLFAQLGGYEAAIQHLNSLPPKVDWVTRHLCPSDDGNYDIKQDRMFYTRANGMAIDAMRTQIEHWEQEKRIDTYERACLLAPMLYEACYTSNTSGVFKGFHNGWGGQTGTALYRILSNYQLRPAVFFDNSHSNRVYCTDALKLSETLKKERETVDIAYLDPPYNQHPYGSNYHVLNTITLWDKPTLTEKIEGRNKAAIRADWRTQRRSAYNYRGDAERAYAELVATVDARYILTSYSTDGMIPLHKLVSACAQRGNTEFVLRKYKRYRVSSQRFSYKPLNVEFVLIVDTRKKHGGPGVEHMCELILKAEQAALDTHPETAVD